MSYSFTVQAASKAEAKEQIAKEWDQIHAAQPIHENDRDAAQGMAEDFVDALNDPDDAQQITLSAYGSVSFNADTNNISAVSATVNAAIVSKA